MRGQEETQAILDNFQNVKDSDIEGFLKNKAIEYNNRKWSYTYLVIQDEPFENGNLIIVEGYFTLSVKIVELTDTVSNSTKKKLFFGTKTDSQALSTILIGQLGKYIGSDRISLIDMEIILDYAMDVIYQIDHRIAFPCTILEYEPCRTGLRRKYDEYGFKELQRPDEYVQMFLIL